MYDGGRLRHLERGREDVDVEISRMNNRESNDHLLGQITLLVIVMLIGSTMLIIALLLWLAEVMGSLTGALVAIGAGCTLISMMLYFGAVRPQVKAIREELSSLYEVARVARSGYQWVSQFIIGILK